MAKRERWVAGSETIKNWKAVLADNQLRIDNEDPNLRKDLFEEKKGDTQPSKIKSGE